MSEDVRYRRSNLREVLLARAVVMLRERGVGAVSLRELAREVGVSHMAPARHFADRRALLEALAVEGFTLLGAQLRNAEAAADVPAEQARLVGRAYVRFVVEEAHLADVMYQHDPQDDGRGSVGRSAQDAFAPLVSLFERVEQTGAASGGTAERTATLFLATLQGLAALMNCGIVRPDDGRALVDDAVSRFVGIG